VLRNLPVQHETLQHATSPPHAILPVNVSKRRSLAGASLAAETGAT
jgi:hypothetical protein